MKHTPGPWTIRNRTNQTPQVWNGTTGIARLDDRHEWPGETEANARLIAAAPDLILALKMFLAQYGGREGDPRERRPEIIAARRAIAKAEREAGR